MFAKHVRKHVENSVNVAIKLSSLTVNQHKNRDRGQAHQANGNHSCSTDDLQPPEHKVADVARLEIRVFQLKHHGTVVGVPVLHRVLR